MSDLDIVHRLRQNATSEDCLNDPYPEILLEAAAEIEQQAATIAELTAVVTAIANNPDCRHASCGHACIAALAKLGEKKP